MKFNPIKWIYETIKFIILDIKSDIKFLIDLKRGKAKVRKISKEEWKELSIKSILKENWIMFLLIFLAFMVGWFIASQQYQQKCNEYIYENYITPANQYLENNRIMDPETLERALILLKSDANLNNFTGIS